MHLKVRWKLKSQSMYFFLGKFYFILLYEFLSLVQFLLTAPYSLCWFFHFPRNGNLHIFLCHIIFFNFVFVLFFLNSLCFSFLLQHEVLKFFPLNVVYCLNAFPFSNSVVAARPAGRCISVPICLTSGSDVVWQTFQMVNLL